MTRNSYFTRLLDLSSYWAIVSPSCIPAGRQAEGVWEARQIPGDTDPEASAGPQSRSLRVVAWMGPEHGLRVALGEVCVYPPSGSRFTAQ
jgi:hypothetical protein